MKKSHVVFMSLAMVLGVASVVMAIAVNSSDAVAAEVTSQLAAGSATHIATTIITGALVVAAGILWYLSFHRKHNELKEQDSKSVKRSSTTSKPKATSKAKTSSAGQATKKANKATSAKAATGKSAKTKATRTAKTTKSTAKSSRSTKK